ncbi:hypothetical protein GEMRC1_013902 [Eukaryota sp. GEM-RC1]
MSDVIHLHVGQAGCAIGADLIQQHDSKLSTFKPIFVDCEPRVVAKLPSTIPKIHGLSGASTNWALGSSQSSLISSTIDTLRRSAESLDWLGSFCITSSITGGTGGGLLSGILSHPDFPVNVDCNVVVPFGKDNTTPLHSFSSTLSMYYINDLVDNFLFLTMIFCLTRTLGKEEVTWISKQGQL